MRCGAPSERAPSLLHAGGRHYDRYKPLPAHAMSGTGIAELLSTNRNAIAMAAVDVAHTSCLVSTYGLRSAA
eukprot:1516834-Rhodomonas_salina.8